MKSRVPNIEERVHRTSALAVVAATTLVAACGPEAGPESESTHPAPTPPPTSTGSGAAGAVDAPAPRSAPERSTSASPFDTAALGIDRPESTVNTSRPRSFRELAAADPAIAQSKNPFADSKWNASRDEQGPKAVEVKFREGLQMRLEDGRPVDRRGKGLADARTREVLEKLSSGHWQRTMTFPPETIDQLRTSISRRSGQAAPDLNLFFTYSVPRGMRLSDVVALLEPLPDVRFVYPLPQYEVAAAPDYQTERPNELPYQMYLDAAEDGGLGVRAAWRTPGARGDGVDFFDLEFGFDPRHVELAGTVGDFEGLDPSEAFPNLRPEYINHGTASMASAVGADDGNGVTGIAPAAGKHFIPVRGDTELSLGFLVDGFCQAIEHPPGDCINLPTALVYPLVSQQLSRGDVLLIELQTAGPRTVGELTLGNQFGAVPVEFTPGNHDALRLLALAGIVVVEAAGNGSQDLDDPILARSEHQPFRTMNGVRLQDSRAILVGAATSGAPWSTHLPGVGSPLPPTGVVWGFSNHGRRVDVHAWGDGIVTAGYGDLYDDEGPALEYTRNYAGTSGASALVAGAVTALQGAYRADYDAHHEGGSLGAHLWSTSMRDLSRRTGVDAVDLDEVAPDVMNSLEVSTRFNLDPDANIGTRPDLEAAIERIRRPALSWGDRLPRPMFSVEPGRLERTADGRAPIDLGFGDGSPLHRGIIDILYTTDGSEPDCSPRCGACDIDRVHIITQATNWRWEQPVWLDLTQGPVTIRARSHVSDCGVPYGPEAIATFE